MNFFVLIVCLLVLSSCGDGIINNLFSRQKEGVITYLASLSTENLSQKQKEDLLNLYNQIKAAPPCEAKPQWGGNEIQFHIENNETLILFAQNFGFRKGFLFDELRDYDYERSLRRKHRDKHEAAAFSIVSVWKTKVPLSEIKEIIKKINRCYPGEYIDTG